MTTKNKKSKKKINNPCNLYTELLRKEIRNLKKEATKLRKEGRSSEEKQIRGLIRSNTLWLNDHDGLIINCDQGHAATCRQCKKRKKNLFKNCRELCGPKKSKKNIDRVKALFDYKADEDDQITITKGEIIIVSDKSYEEWWWGHIEGKSNKMGYFPSSFVEKIRCPTWCKSIKKTKRKNKKSKKTKKKSKKINNHS